MAPWCNRTLLGAAMCAANWPSGVRAQQMGPDPAASSADATTLDTVVLVGRRPDSVDEAISASEGTVGPEEIADRPMLRTGDLLEFVPGLIATSHSGSGKANQYFLR